MRLFVSSLVIICAITLVSAQTCSTINPQTCTGINNDGRSQCGKNRACLGGTCKGVTGVPCSSDSHCYTHFKCVGCTCQHNGTTDTNAIIAQAWPSLDVPADTTCPLGRKDYQTGNSLKERVQCEYPVGSNGQQRTWITPGLENAVCPHPSVNSYFDTSRMPCSEHYGYACINGRCINQCDQPAPRPPCNVPNSVCSINGAPGVCTMEKNLQYKCFPITVAASCKVDWDCPSSQSCINCTCRGDGSSGYGYGARCKMFKLKEIGDALIACQTGGYGATCQTAPAACVTSVLSGLSSDTTIIEKVRDDVRSADAENYGDCKLAASLAKWCPRN